MADINKAQVLLLVKQRLNRLTGIDSLDDYLMARIEGAIGELAEQGITLTGSLSDTMLLVDYTVYQYQSRDKPGGEPEWLRRRLRRRWLQKDGGGNDA